jgi:hypothetical protein
MGKNFIALQFLSSTARSCRRLALVVPRLLAAASVLYPISDYFTKQAEIVERFYKYKNTKEIIF